MSQYGSAYTFHLTEVLRKLTAGIVRFQIASSQRMIPAHTLLHSASTVPQFICALPTPN